MVARGQGTWMQWYVAKGHDGVMVRGHGDMVARG